MTCCWLEEAFCNACTTSHPHLLSCMSRHHVCTHVGDLLNKSEAMSVPQLVAHKRLCTGTGTKAQLSIQRNTHAHLNICANLANHVWITKAVQVVVLYLQQQQNLLYLLLSRHRDLVCRKHVSQQCLQAQTNAHDHIRHMLAAPGDFIVLVEDTTPASVLLACKSALHCTRS